MPANGNSSLSSAKVGGSGAFLESAWLFIALLTLGLRSGGRSFLLEGIWHDVGG